MSVELISGNELKLLLKRRGIKINDLVSDINIPRVSVSKYLNDKATMPAFFLIKVANYAGLSISDLTEGDADIINIDYQEVPKESVKLIAAEKANEYEVIPVLVPADLSDLEKSLRQAHKALMKLEEVMDRMGDELDAVRDTGGMALIKSGIDAYTLMRQMRHQDLETTQKYLKELGTVNESIRDLKGDILLPL